MSRRQKTPLWQRLIDLGMCADRKEAEAFILAGDVLVDESPGAKAGTVIRESATVRFRRPPERFVGRGGEKLEGALEDFGISVDSRVALDCGASTGGFTDCLIQRGASLVYSVDAGFGQLSGRLRADPRVVNLERRNLGSIGPAELGVLPSIITLDLSYLSLETAIPLAFRLLGLEGIVVALVKPLFEVRDATIRRTGRIESDDVYRRVLLDLVGFCESAGFGVHDVTRSRLSGANGTVEFFLLVGPRPTEPPVPEIRTKIERIVSSAGPY